MSYAQEYSVATVARIMGVANETVKRWIRAGKLKGSYEAKRYGYVIKAEDLDSFIASDPKYRKWLNIDEDRAFINFCKEIMFDLYRIEAERLAGEDHGPVWNDGFKAAILEVEKKVKEKIIARESPRTKAEYYTKLNETMIG